MAEVNTRNLGRILVGWGSMDGIGGEVERLDPFKVGIVTDSVVAKLWLNKVLGSLDRDASTFIIGDGEKSKNIGTVVSIWRNLVKEGFTRKSLIIGLGGGVICDISGFVASTYMRGTLLALIPTTLMAQTDAAIGGKTGVNFHGKNIIGTFYSANVILIDPMTLTTLPREEFVNGLVEPVKCGIIKDKKFFEFLERNVFRILSLNRDLIENLIIRSVEIKAEIVDVDQREMGLRRILNFGHTIGHGIEKVANYSIKHGFAVSAGMIASCKIAEKLLGFSETERVAALLESMGLPINHSFDPNKVLKAIKMDKKAWYGDLIFVLPSEIGKVAIRKVPEELVLKVLREISR